MRFEDIFENIASAMGEGRSTTWIMNNCVGAGWEYEEYHDFCEELSDKAEETVITYRDRWVELAEQCWEGLYETDWEEDDPYL